MLELLKQQVENILMRNKRVEIEKAWETSMTRKLTLMILTYMVIVLLFLSLGVPQPFIGAITPTLGYFLSTLSLPMVKRLWVKKYFHREE